MKIKKLCHQKSLGFLHFNHSLDTQNLAMRLKLFHYKLTHLPNRLFLSFWIRFHENIYMYKRNLYDCPCFPNIYNISYVISIFSTSFQASMRDSSLYILNRIRNKQAKLWVSCFSRFGLAFPRNPIEDEI